MSEHNAELESVDDRVVRNYSYQAEPLAKGETAAVIGLLNTAVVGFAAFVRYDLKEQKRIMGERKAKEAERQKERDDFNEWVDSQPPNGKVVVKAQVGAYIAIPVEAYKDVEIKRMPGITY